MRPAASLLRMASHPPQTSQIQTSWALGGAKAISTAIFMLAATVSGKTCFNRAVERRNRWSAATHNWRYSALNVSNWEILAPWQR